MRVARKGTVEVGIDISQIPAKRPLVCDDQLHRPVDGWGILDESLDSPRATGLVSVYGPDDSYLGVAFPQLLDTHTHLTTDPVL